MYTATLVAWGRRAMRHAATMTISFRIAKDTEILAKNRRPREGGRKHRFVIKFLINNPLKHTKSI